MIDLVREFSRDGYKCEVIANVSEISEELQNTSIKALGFNFRGLAKPIRLLGEVFAPIFLYLRHFPAFNRERYDACIVYSPSIFWFIIVRLLGKSIVNNKILILRDLFPIWMADVGILKKNSVTYQILDYFCLKQLQSFDRILVQNQGDIKILRDHYDFSGKLDVLGNWYSASPTVQIAQDVKNFCANDKYTLAVVGNFGVAQDLKHSSQLLKILMEEFSDVQLLLIGQGNEAKLFFQKKLTHYAGRLHFSDPVPHDEVMSILKFVDAGYFSLDAKNNQGHFPGKVLSYIFSGIPVFGSVGVDAPIKLIIENNGLGAVSTTKNRELIINDFVNFKVNKWSSAKIRKYAVDNFSSQRACETIKEYLPSEKF